MQAKTHLKTNTVTPFWDQAFTLDNLPADCSHVVVQLYRFAFVIAHGILIVVSAGGTLLRLPSKTVVSATA